MLMYSNEISVDEAIKKGRKWIINLSLIIFFSTLVIGFYSSFIKNYYPKHYIVFFGNIGLILMLVYRQIAIPKWKIWAFGNVRNVHELERKAKYYGILNKTNSIFEKTEFFSNEDKLKWKEIQKKFSESDVFVDDRDIPQEVQYFKVKTLILFRICGFLIGMVFLTKFFISNNKESFLIIIIPLLLWFLIGGIIDFIESYKPFLILNDKGITTQEGKFYSWIDIKNDRVYNTFTGQSKIYWLSFETKYGQEKIMIDEIKNREKLVNDLLLFRSRFNQKNPNFKINK